MGKAQKQFALVWWIGTKHSNIIPLTKLKKKDREMGSIVTLNWDNGKKKKSHEAKIVLIGDDEAELAKVPLTVDGTIADASTKIFSSEVVLRKQENSCQERMIAEIKKSNKKNVDTKLLADSPIFAKDCASMEKPKHDLDGKPKMRSKNGSSKSKEPLKLHSSLPRDRSQLQISLATDYQKGSEKRSGTSGGKNIHKIRRPEEISRSNTNSRCDSYPMNRYPSNMSMSSQAHGQSASFPLHETVNQQYLHRYHSEGYTESRPHGIYNDMGHCNENVFRSCSTAQNTQQDNFPTFFPSVPHYENYSDFHQYAYPQQKRTMSSENESESMCFSRSVQSSQVRTGGINSYSMPPVPWTYQESVSQPPSQTFMGGLDSPQITLGTSQLSGVITPQIVTSISPKLPEGRVLTSLNLVKHSGTLRYDESQREASPQTTALNSTSMEQKKNASLSCRQDFSIGGVDSEDIVEDRRSLRGGVDTP